LRMFDSQEEPATELTPESSPYKLKQ